MDLQNERKEVVYKFDLDCTEEEKDALKKLAIERFAKDEQAQLEYAVISILAEATDGLTAEKLLQAVDKKTKKVKKEKGNGDKSSSRK